MKSLVLVTGDRNYTDHEYLRQFLLTFHLNFDILKLVHGDAKGADTMADQWAKSAAIPVQAYPAQWDRYGRAAGPIRNRAMWDAEMPDVVIAFHKNLSESRGTKDMMTYATERGAWVIHADKEDPNKLQPPVSLWDTNDAEV